MSIFKMLHFLASTNDNVTIDVINRDRPSSNRFASDYYNFLKESDSCLNIFKFNLSNLDFTYPNETKIIMRDFYREEYARGIHRDILVVINSSNINAKLLDQLKMRTKKLIIIEKD